MKQFKDIKKKIEWEQYYDPNFNWNNPILYSCDNNLSEEFIREFKDKVDWEYISISQMLSEDFIKEFQNKVDWTYISECQQLSEDFIKEFQNKVDWKMISSYQKLSEGFIREFKDKVDWLYICRFQNFTSLQIPLVELIQFHSCLYPHCFC